MSTAKKENKKNLFIQLMSGSFMRQDNFLQQLPFLLYLVGLMIVYIAYGYFAEKTVRAVTKEGSHLKELKAEYTTTFSNLEQLKQQSNVANTIYSTGLRESTVPPKKILVNK